MNRPDSLAQATIDAVSAHICVLDGAGRILSVNRAWREFGVRNRPAGATPDGDVGQDYLAVCDAAEGADSAEARAMAAGIRQVMRGERDEFALEYPCHGPDEQRWFMAVVTPLAGDGGKVVVAHENITGRRLAEIALQDSEARLRRSLMLLPEAVLVVDGERVSFANEAAWRLFGADAVALIGAAPLDLVHPDTRAAAREHLRALRRGDTAGPVLEVKIVRRDGAVRFVEWTAAVVEDRGQPLILAVLRDVTELRRLRAELARSVEDLQHLAAAQQRLQENERSRIARELHDDLQQRLSAIKMDLADIEQRLAVDPAGVVPMIRAVDALTTETILSTRRIVNGLRPQALDGLGLVPALHELVQQFARRNRIDARLDVAAPDDTAAPAPEAMSAEVSTCLYRVVQEALTNVAKHARAHSVTVNLSRPGPGAVGLQVVDDGCGIDAADPRRPGAFGLLGMQERVRCLGGRLSVEAGAQGIGTTVDVWLPSTAAGA